MRAMFIKFLQRRAKAVLLQFEPKIVAVTGSMGKTGTRQAITAVLLTKFEVRSPAKNFNNEIGVPLTILGEEASPGRSVAGWLRLFWRSYHIRSYPEILVLEFGADHPGDIQALCDLAPPNVGVVTGLSTVHAEYFKDAEALAHEKATLPANVSKDGLVVLNADQERVKEMASGSVARVQTYGVRPSDVQAHDIRIDAQIDDVFSPGEVFVRTFAHVSLPHKLTLPLELTNMLGYGSVMGALAAIAVGTHFGVPHKEMLKTLEESLAPAPGRLRPLAGIKGSLLIDDSYNAAPSAMQHGLDVLRLLPLGHTEGRRIAALGKMAELGAYTEEEHRFIGFKVAEVADVFVGVGEEMKIAVSAAEEAGMDPGAIFWFTDSVEAEKFLDEYIRTGDIVYVKGSQSSRMERVAKGVMAEPLRAKELLVRQSEDWL